MKESRKAVFIGGYAGSFLKFRSPLILTLRKMCYQVVVLLPDFGDREIEQEIIEFSNVYSVEFDLFDFSRSGLHLAENIQAICKLRRKIMEIDPVLIFSFTPKVNVLAGLACFGMRHVSYLPTVNGLGFVFTESLRKSFVLRLVLMVLFGISFSRAKFVVFQNSEDRSFLERFLIVRSEKCVVIEGGGVESTSSLPELPNRPVFLMACRLLVHKGVFEYLDAADRVLESYPSAKFILAGDFDAENPAGIRENELKQRLLASGVEFVGYRSDISELIALSSCVVLPSYREGLPRICLEALSIGRPLIVSDAPGCFGLVKRGLNGFHSNVGDVESLYYSMLCVLALSSSELLRMSVESKNLFSERFSKEVVLTQWSNLLEKIEK